MAYFVARASQQQWRDSPAVRGLREAVLVDAAAGAQHLEVRLCELDAGAVIDAHRHPFEASWYFFSGSGRLELAGLAYDVGAGDYAVAPVSVAHRLSATEPLRWLSVWAPKPPSFRGARTSVPAEMGPGIGLGRPSETDPRHRYAGHLAEPEAPAFADLSMPGYHGPNIKNIFIRMMVDRLLGAQHHTFFLATIAPRSGPGQAAGEHYHPFEEIYYFLSGGMRGRLDGDDVPVGAGDLVWVSVDATHGFVNENDEPARWLEVQSPVPPDSEAFFFPDDWRNLGA